MGQGAGNEDLLQFGRILSFTKPHSQLTKTIRPGAVRVVMEYEPRFRQTARFHRRHGYQRESRRHRFRVVDRRARRNLPWLAQFAKTTEQARITLSWKTIDRQSLRPSLPKKATYLVRQAQILGRLTRNSPAAAKITK